MLKHFLLILLLLGSGIAVSADAQIIPECRSVPGTCEQCVKDCEKDCTVKNADGTTTISDECKEACEKSRKCDKPACQAVDLLRVAVNIYNFLLGLAAMIALLVFVWAGLRMFYWSYMENAEQELQGAKYTLTRAVAGLVIILMAYVIVNTLIVLLGGGGITEVFQEAGIFGGGSGGTDDTCPALGGP